MKNSFIIFLAIHFLPLYIDSKNHIKKTKMKNSVLVLVFAMALISCSSSETAVPATDSIKADTVVSMDSVKMDSVKVDTVK